MPGDLVVTGETRCTCEIIQKSRSEISNMSTTAALLPKPGGGGAWQKIDGKWQSAAVSEKNVNLKPKLGDIKTERNLDIQVGSGQKAAKY